MENNFFPITPCPELVLKWLEDSPEDGDFAIADHIATQAARWGGDQELEACCEWLNNTDVDDSQEAAKDLRAARRPQAPPETVEIDGYTYRLVK